MVEVRRRLIRLSIGLAVVFELCACSAAAGTSGRAGNAAPGATTGTQCVPENVTQQCSCLDQQNAPGRQICLGGAWLACECNVAASKAATGASGTTASSRRDGGVGSPQVVGTTGDPTGNGSSTRFDWNRTVPTGGSCLTGHYAGALSGTYASSGLFGFPASISTDDVAGDGGVVKPGLELSLNQRPGSGEVFDTDGGKIRGTVGGSVPFEMEVVGSLDCASGKFTGQLINGWYLFLGNRYHYQGTIEADYNKITHQFINGKWQVTETIPDGGLVLGQPGGSGDWNADYK